MYRTVICTWVKSPFKWGVCISEVKEQQGSSLIPQSHEKVPMEVALYKKRNVGSLSSVCGIEEHPCMFIVTEWPQIRQQQIAGQTITYNRAANLWRSSFDSTQHTEWQQCTVSIVYKASTAAFSYDPSTQSHVVVTFSKEVSLTSDMHSTWG